MEKGQPSSNLLAQAGLITNESGRVSEPSTVGRLELPWLLKVSKEASRAAREQLKKGRSIDDETRYGWFIASTEAEFQGLKLLLKEDWRRALKAWKGAGVFNLHNRATLHRALLYSPDCKRPDAHIRECLRLYHHLSELVPKQKTYRVFQEELIELLKRSIKKCHESGDDESASRSLKILAQTVGLVAVGHLQNQFFGSELKAFRVKCAKVQKELLAYQGLAHAPPADLLQQCDTALTDQLIPEAARFSLKLVEGSKERNEVELLVAQACGILSQSYSKADDSRGAKRWLGEGMRWEPSAVENWKSLPDESFGDEESASVSFPEKVAEEDVTPEPKGSFLLGIQSTVVRRELGVAREEWLESAFLCFLPVFPIRRFAAYKNLETDEVGYFLKIPMTVLDHIRQGIFVLLFSFGLALSVFVVKDFVNTSEPETATHSAEEVKKEIDLVVEKIKHTAQKESELSNLESPTKAQAAELETVRADRVKLIERLQSLEQKRKR